MQAGTSLVQLKMAGTAMATLKDSGYTAERLKQQGYTAAELAFGARGRVDIKTKAVGADDGGYTAKEVLPSQPPSPSRHTHAPCASPRSIFAVHVPPSF